MKEDQEKKKKKNQKEKPLGNNPLNIGNRVHQ